MRGDYLLELGICLYNYPSVYMYIQDNRHRYSRVANTTYATLYMRGEIDAYKYIHDTFFFGYKFHPFGMRITVHKSFNFIIYIDSFKPKIASTNAFATIKHAVI